MMTVTTSVQFTKGRAGRKPAQAALVSPVGRTPRISKLMALAIKFDRMLRDGVVADQSELARLARVTQPRMTQIMNLNHLVPDIQEELLFLTPRGRGRDLVHERLLRAVAVKIHWPSQRQLWDRARMATTPLPSSGSPI